MVWLSLATQPSIVLLLSFSSSGTVSLPWDLTAQKSCTALPLCLTDQLSSLPCYTLSFYPVVCMKAFKASLIRSPICMLGLFMGSYQNLLADQAILAGTLLILFGLFLLFFHIILPLQFCGFIRF